MRKEPITWLIIAACIVGLIVSIISLNTHYGTNNTFCTVSERLNCDTVKRGQYSEILGVPVALLGVIGYLVFGLLTLKERKITKILSLKRKETLLYLAIGATIMFAFALYLTVLEAFVINAWCMLCVSSQLAVLIITIGSWLSWKNA